MIFLILFYDSIKVHFHYMCSKVAHEVIGHLNSALKTHSECTEEIQLFRSLNRLPHVDASAADDFRNHNVAKGHCS